MLPFPILHRERLWLEILSKVVNNGTEMVTLRNVEILLKYSGVTHPLVEIITTPNILEEEPSKIGISKESTPMSS
jgi:hypothetical protein